MIEGNEKRKRHLVFELQSSRVYEKRFKHLALVVQKVDNPIHWINLYPLDSRFPNTHPLDSDLSNG